MASSTLPGVARATAISARQQVPAALAILTVLSQVGYPLCTGDARQRLTVVTVLLWCAASVTHAVVTRGVRFAGGLLVVSAGVGFATEVIGVATGEPFGSYDYAATLGPRVAGVPLVVPLAWAMMAYPALLVGRRIAASRLGGRALRGTALGGTVFWGTLALASWDLFLDPQMVDAGHWHFTGAGPTVNAIPVSNSVGWIIVSFVIMMLLAQLDHPAEPPDDRLPLALFLWTYGSSVLAAAVFFDHPGVAVVGGLVMGAPTLMLIRTLRRERSPVGQP